MEERDFTMKRARCTNPHVDHSDLLYGLLERSGGTEPLLIFSVSPWSCVFTLANITLFLFSEFVSFSCNILYLVKPVSLVHLLV